jgi:hypothetical protein
VIRRRIRIARTPRLIAITCIGLVMMASACDSASPRGAVAASAPVRQAGRGSDAASAMDAAPGMDAAAPWTAGRTFRGDGFTLGYPAAARLQALDPDGDERSAIEIAGLPGCAGLCHAAVRTYDDPSQEGLGAWVREMVREDSVDTGDEDERAYQVPPSEIQLGGMRAIRLERTCEDCAWVEYYVGRGTRIVLVELWMDGHVGPADQARLSAKLEALLRTFRWDAASHEEPVPPAPPEPIES